MEVILYLIIVGFLVNVLVFGVGYSESEEQTSSDTSPKHFMILNGRTAFIFIFQVVFLLSSMVL